MTAQPEKASETPSLGKSLQKKLEGLSKEIEALGEGDLTGAKKAIESIHAAFQDKKTEMGNAVSSTRDSLGVKYEQIKKQINEKFPELEGRLRSVDDLYDKFKENTVEFGKGPFEKMNGFFTGLASKFVLPEWLKKWTGFESASDLAGSAARMGKRLYFNFMLGINKMVPGWAAPLFGGTIDTAREGLILLDAEDGFRRAIKELQKKPALSALTVAWDPIIWETWRTAFDTAAKNDPKLSARVFVERHIKAKLGSMNNERILAVKTMKDIPAPGEQTKASETVPGDLSAFGLAGWASGQEREIPGTLSYKNYTTDADTAKILIAKDEIVRGSERIKVTVTGDAKMLFKPVIMENHLRQSIVAFVGTKDGKSYREEFPIGAIGAKTIENPAMKITFEQKII
ncbi:MAG: hypothetical protein AAB489_04070 [Patescibacteria group bacterium]